MTLLGHTSPDMTMRYVNVALTDLRREFDLARSQPTHLVHSPRPSPRFDPASTGLSTRCSAQHVLEMFHRALSEGAARNSLARLSNRLAKILAEARKLPPP
jgi:hypothetical protein